METDDAGLPAHKEEIIVQILSDISAQLQAGKAKLVKELVQKAIDEGIPVEQITLWQGMRYETGLSPTADPTARDAFGLSIRLAISP